MDDKAKMSKRGMIEGLLGIAYSSFSFRLRPATKFSWQPN
jgi:hypothetical protein